MRFFLILMLGLGACSSARSPVPPGTIPEARNPTISDEQYGHDVLQALSERYKIDYNNPQLDRIQEIVDRLTKAARADQQPWHVYLFKEDAMKNAAATRGNHIFVWTGMLNEAKSDGELATILAHEIGHVLAGHTAEDPNEEIKRIMIQVAGIAAGVAVGVTTRYGGQLGDVASSLTRGVGEGLFMNPYARGDEYEADQIGIELMAEAKYDPKEALSFWERVSHNPDFSSSFSFLSTHPAAPDRLERLRKLLPYAEARFRGEAIPAPPPEYAQYANPSGPRDTTPGTPPRASLPGNEPITNRVGDRGGAGQRPEGDRDRMPLPPPTGGGGDSFDLRDKIPDARGGEQNWADSWKVIADRAVLYREASAASKKIGEFRQGAVVQSAGRKAGWLRVRHPDHGFLREADLMPVYGGAPSGRGPSRR